MIHEPRLKDVESRCIHLSIGWTQGLVYLLASQTVSSSDLSFLEKLTSGKDWMNEGERMNRHMNFTHFHLVLVENGVDSATMHTACLQN